MSKRFTTYVLRTVSFNWTWLILIRINLCSNDVFRVNWSLGLISFVYSTKISIIDSYRLSAVTNGFLFSRRIFPQANDCSVRCNSASSTWTIETRQRILLQWIQTEFCLLFDIIVIQFEMLIKKKKHQCLEQWYLKFFRHLKKDVLNEFIFHIN